ncbi:Mbov_0396 family ICE element transmembrane protein [Mycoplasma mycoides]|uniref:Mbov_0396 family ICE element transmembrane protein n=1 Tax=Mycoplasma mycoides TaxID=2102 RepID=UPI002240309C|nr:E3 binding domain-containing protein [Mycoplasma mycoides]QVJ95226.1 E3 binding domain-containing protein [Mycoplasma mycoides subsp. capri]
MSIFRKIGDLLTILKNLHTLPFWLILLSLLLIPATLAEVVDFLGRDLVRILIFGGDNFNWQKLPPAFKILGIVTGVVGIVGFGFFLIIVLFQNDTRKQIRQALKGIIFATFFVVTMPIFFFVLQYLVSVFFDLIKLALGFKQKSSADIVIETILNTGKLKNDFKISDGINEALTSVNPLDWASLVENVNPIIPIIATVFVGWTYIQISVAILMKSMELFTLFISAPIYAVSGIFDNQKRLKKYIREKIIGKSFAVLGLMFVWNVSFLFLDVFSNRIVEALTSSIQSKIGKGNGQISIDRSISPLLNFVGLMAASFFISKGANLLGDLTGESINIAGASPLVKGILKIGAIAATAGAAKVGLAKSFLNKNASTTDTPNSDSSSTLTNNLTNSTTTTHSTLDKVNKSKTPNSNTIGILHNESNISGLNNPPNSSLTFLSSSSNSLNDSSTITSFKKSMKSYKPTEEFAKENNIDLSTITVSGQNGRVLKSDVQNAINEQNSLKTLNAAGSNNLSDSITKVDKWFDDKNSDQKLLNSKSVKDNSINQKDNEQIKKDQTQDKKLEDVNNKQKSAFEKFNEFKKEYDRIGQIKDTKNVVKELKNLNKLVEKLEKELQKNKKLEVKKENKSNLNQELLNNKPTNNNKLVNDRKIDLQINKTSELKNLSKPLLNSNSLKPDDKTKAILSLWKDVEKQINKSIKQESNKVEQIKKDKEVKK